MPLEWALIVEFYFKINYSLWKHNVNLQLNIAHTIFRCIIDDDLGKYPYKILSTQKLLLADHKIRLAYANSVVEQTTADYAFWKRILSSFTDHTQTS